MDLKTIGLGVAGLIIVVLLVVVLRKGEQKTTTTTGGITQRSTMQSDSIEGLQGPTGPTGSVGPTGPTGPTGSEGPQGSRGFAGNDGEQGPPGEQGVRGDTGPTGPISPLPCVNTGSCDLTVDSLCVRGVCMTPAQLSMMSGLEVSDSLYTITRSVNTSSKLKEAGNDLIPRGIIAMWSGRRDQIPAGWALCDGTNGTPDLQGRFVLGATRTNLSTDSNDRGGVNIDVGATGGERNHTLTIAEMPSHNHTTSGRYMTIDYTQEHPWINAFGGAGGYPYRSDINPTGGGQAHNNMPPFYALAYIMKL